MQISNYLQLSVILTSLSASEGTLCRAESWWSQLETTSRPTIKTDGRAN